MNLDFEAAKIVPLSTNADASVNVATTDALPGWQVFAGTNQLSSIPYAELTGSLNPEFELLGSNKYVINGNFDILLRLVTSISQTGLVPTNATSLLFDAGLGGSPPFGVVMDGQVLSYSAISNAVNSYGQSYKVYGADISTFAGQVETLTFFAPLNMAPPGGVLDDIQFSDRPLPVPEPGGLAWLAIGSGVLIYIRRRKWIGS